jgi:thiamine transport system permease protein
MDYTILYVFANTVFQSAISTIISVGLCLPIAHFFYAFHFPGRGFFIALFPLLAIMPSKLVGMCTSMFYGICGLPGIIISHCILDIPLSLYVLHSAYQKCEPTWDLIAQELGATSWQCYRDIYLPFLRSTIMSISIAIFLLCFTSFSLPLILGTSDYHCTPDIKMYQLYQMQDWTSVILYAIGRLFIIIPITLLYKKSAYSLYNVAMQEKRYASPWYAKNGYYIAWLLFCIAIAVLIIGPLITLLTSTINADVFNFWAQILTGACDSVIQIPVYRVIFNSILLAFASGIGALLCGYVLSKMMRNTCNISIRNFVMLVTAGVCIIGNVGCGIIFSWLSTSQVPLFAVAVLCHIILNYPFTYRIIDAQLITYQTEWDFTAQTFGANTQERLKTLEFPFLKTAFFQAFCIAFGLSLTEVGAGSIMFGSTGMTIPMAIRLYREHGCIDGVIGLSVILLLLVFIVAYLGSWFLQRYNYS